MFNKERRDNFRENIRDLYSDEDETLVMLAYRHAVLGHAKQERDGGGEFVDHPIRVALILLNELHISDRDLIIAALLHDVIEDAEKNETWIFTWKSLRLVFGDEVAELVDALTKRKPQGETRAQYFTRVRQASRQARIIKLADRLDNVRELSSCDIEKQHWYLKETREVMLPLARRTHPYLTQEIEIACEKTRERLAEKPTAS